MNRPTEEEIAGWYPRLFRTALRLTGSYNNAADLTQQTFAKALSAWDSFDGAALRTTWLHQILMNCARDWSRRRAVRAGGSVGQGDLNRVAEGGPDGHERLENEEQLAVLRLAVEGLPLPVRQAFVLAVMDGYTYREVGELLGASVGTIATRVHEARKQLRATMQKAFPEASR